METHGVSKVIQVAVTYPTVTSKMLLPTELDTAMSPKPFRATITDVIRSGIEVPAAKNVSPITCKKKGVGLKFHGKRNKYLPELTSGGILAVSPATFAHHTIRYEYAAIHAIEPMNVTG